MHTSIHIYTIMYLYMCLCIVQLSNVLLYTRHINYRVKIPPKTTLFSFKITVLHFPLCRFVYSLALSVPVQATLHNVARQSDVAIQLKFPDGRRLLFSPKPCDFRCVGTQELKLDTTVVMSHGLWTGIILVQH